MKIISFEGSDNCGKSTQISLVAKELTRKGFSVKTQKFPVYGSDTGVIIGQMLHEGYKGDLLKTVAFAYLQCKNKLDWLEQEFNRGELFDFLLLDRFVLSSKVYDEIMLGGLLEDQGVISSILFELDSMYEQIESLASPEYVIFKSSKLFSREEQDKNDSDLDLQEQINNHYVNISKINHKVIGVIDSEEAGGEKLRPAESITPEITKLILKS